MKYSLGRLAVLKRAAFAEEIAINTTNNGHNTGCNTITGTQGEWISSAIIAEWIELGYLELRGGVGVITELGKRVASEKKRGNDDE